MPKSRAVEDLPPASKNDAVPSLIFMKTLVTEISKLQSYTVFSAVLTEERQQVLKRRYYFSITLTCVFTFDGMFIK